MSTQQGKGRLEWFDQTKGFGGIRAHNGREFFVRYTAFPVDEKPEIFEGRLVEFEWDDTASAETEAHNVRIATGV